MPTMEFMHSVRGRRRSMRGFSSSGKRRRHDDYPLKSALGSGACFRFEMPFNVWCLGCNNHVGMGVRYNAEKKKVGNYYTTPIFEFRMKCHLCDNYYTIRTDPKVSRRIA